MASLIQAIYFWQKYENYFSTESFDISIAAHTESIAQTSFRFEKDKDKKQNIWTKKAMMDRKMEVPLAQPPTDIISSVKFAPNSNQYLLVSSWDGTVRMYDTSADSLRQKYLHDAPVLDCAFQVHFSLFLPMTLQRLNLHPYFSIGCRSRCQWWSWQYVESLRFKYTFWENCRHAQWCNQMCSNGNKSQRNPHRQLG